MVGSLLISLLNPMLSAVFAAAFGLIWRKWPGNRHIAMFAVAYAAYGTAFLLQTVHRPFGDPGNGLLADIVLAVAFFLFIRGMTERAGVSMPVLPLAVLTAAGFPCLLWFMFVHPDLTGRMFSANFMFGGMLVVTALRLRHAAKKRPVDRLLLSIVLASGLYSYIRTIGMWFIEGPIANRAQYDASLSAIILNFSSAFCALLLALSLIAVIAIDITEGLRQASVTDPLSGLLNRRGFEEEVGDVLRRRRKLGIPVSFIICDLDFFKSINDRFGHACGDRVITAFGAGLREAARGGIAGRLGGEEFVVVLPDTNIAGAHLFAEAIRTSCAALDVAGLPESQTITASFGVAEIRPGENFGSALRRADLALLDAKRGGRDCVRVSETVAPTVPLSHIAAN